jgi:hypothetical protein
MKKLCVKPGFEFIFALSIIAIIGLPPLVFAQNTKDIEIKINDGDTVVNGKNIKDLSPADRKEALKDIDNLGNMTWQRAIFMKRGQGDTTGGKRVIIRRGQRGDDFAEHGFALGGDSAMHQFRLRFRGPKGRDSMMSFNYRINPDRDMELEPRDFGLEERDMDLPMMRGRAFGRVNRRNTQNFSYSTTGSDGISTQINYSVSDVSPERARQLTGSDKIELELSDLSLVPEFTSGKTLLLFGLQSGAPAEVKFMDHDGKVIWTEKSISGNFSKSFVLGLNGIYLLQVKQGGKTALKRIMKEE